MAERGVTIGGKFYPRPDQTSTRGDRIEEAVEEFLFRGGEAAREGVEAVQSGVRSAVEGGSQAARAGTQASVDASRLMAENTGEIPERLLEALQGIPVAVGSIPSPLQIVASATEALNTDMFGAGNLEQNVKAAKAILSLDEESPDLPESLKGVSEEFHGALEDVSREFGSVSGNRSGPADAKRHVVGSRRAALREGVLPTLAGGVGHEVSNVVGALSGKFRQLGTGRSSVPLKETLENSYMDIYNNMLGIISALVYPGELTPEQEALFLNLAQTEGALE